EVLEGGLLGEIGTRSRYPDVRMPAACLQPEYVRGDVRRHAVLLKDQPLPQPDVALRDWRLGRPRRDAGLGLFVFACHERRNCAVICAKRLRPVAGVDAAGDRRPVYVGLSTQAAAKYVTTVTTTMPTRLSHSPARAISAIVT